MAYPLCPVAGDKAAARPRGVTNPLRNVCIMAGKRTPHQSKSAANPDDTSPRRYARSTGWAAHVRLPGNFGSGPNTDHSSHFLFI
jgi:hypothetical protein